MRPGPTHAIFPGLEVMLMQSWRELEGSVLDGWVGLDRVVSPSPAFSAHLISDHRQPVLVRFLPERSGDELLARCTGASCLSHPNLQ